jgi:hypothetical protein
MKSHRSIMNALARAIAASENVRAFCVEHFGRGLDVHVGAYAAQFPDENDAPFCWITPQEESEGLKEDEVFTVHLVVAACPTDSEGRKVIENVIIERTADANGLTLNGGNEQVEELRDIILEVARDAKAGAIVNRIRREENDISHFPLEWASVFIEYFEPEGLN